MSVYENPDSYGVTNNGPYKDWNSTRNGTDMNAEGCPNDPGLYSPDWVSLLNRVVRNLENDKVFSICFIDNPKGSTHA